MSLAEQSLSLSSLAVIPCKKEHQGWLGESGMAPRYLSWVLDHLVAASKVSKVSQEKGEKDSRWIWSRRMRKSPWVLKVGVLCATWLWKEDEFAVKGVDLR